MKYTLVLALIMCCCISCRNASLSPEEKTRVIEEVTASLDAHNRAVRASGFMAEFEYLDSSDDFFWVPPGNTSAISYDSVATILKHNAPGFRSMQNSFVSLRVYPHTMNLATYTARLHSVLVDTAGKVMESDLLETAVVIRRIDGWKLLQGQTTIINEQ